MEGEVGGWGMLVGGVKGLRWWSVDEVVRGGWDYLYMTSILVTLQLGDDRHVEGWELQIACSWYGEPLN